MKTRLMRAGLTLLLPVFLAAATGCILSRPSAREAAPTGPRKLSAYTYFEEGSLVHLSVNVSPARGHAGDDWLPLEIGVVNKSLDSLTLNVEEGVRLRDLSGREYPSAPLAETAKVRLSDTTDRQRDPFVLREILATRFAVYTWVAPSFQNREGYQPFTRIVPLPKRSYTVGRILVKNPGTSLAGQRFDLVLSAPELKEPIFATFSFE